MGREAVCTCDWAGKSAHVKALLETSEVVLRGEIRKQIPFRQIKNLKVRGDRLCFTVDGEIVQLVLGAGMAEKWAEAIRNPPSLARKLGISSETAVWVIGESTDEALQSALAEAGSHSANEAALIVAVVDTPSMLRAALKKASAAIQAGTPIWVVYAKGAGHPLNEAGVLSLVRAEGLVDTKVASVSVVLTAMRFARRKS